MAEIRINDLAASSAQPAQPADPAAEANRVNDQAARLIMAGRFGEARAMLEALLARMPGLPGAWNNLASVRKTLGDLTGALDAIRQAVALAPRHAEFHYNLGNVLSAGGEHRAAAAAYRDAVARQPSHSAAWNGLGLCFSRMSDEDPTQRLVQARDAYLRALLCDSGNGHAWNNLGAIFYAENLPYRAIAAVREAIAAQPDFAMPYNNLANIYRDVGRIDDAFAAFATALRLDPGYRDAQTNLIFTLDFDLRQDTASQQAERQKWAARHAAMPALPATARPAAAPPADPERPLHVGYVSGDFKVHSAAATFAAPILHHDRDRFRVTCYYSDTGEDSITARFRAAAQAWRPIGPLSDQAVAEQVRADGVDILVDLSGHTAGHRLGVFARRPAPVQVTAWGHCTGTGMRQMDALLVDPVLVPAAERHLFAETVVDLPCALGFEPFQTPPPAMPPAGHAGPAIPAAGPAPVTFGALGRGGKAGPDSIKLWAKVLHAVTGSRLYLKDRQYEDRMRQRDIVLQFSACGIDSARLLFAGRTDWNGHLAAYWNVDIALDTLPQGGGVTALEALWMGVPVISLYGRFPSSRIAASILTACGHADLVAQDPAGFVAIAGRLASRVESLRSGREAMRDALRRTIPYDPPAYARAVEAVYRQLWRRHCAALP
ncbi:MAG: tetratricopeptide repeat protein [Sneathiellaceae bacterium]